MTTIHTVPVRDLIEHDTSGLQDCLCGPEVVPVECDDGSVNWQIIHHSLDGREHSEPDHDVDNCPFCQENLHGP